MYTTGIPACDALREIAFTGNIIPQNWYKIFVKRDLKNPKPHLLAINVLADIVYWYRPVEVRDERTGEVVGCRKKFAADLLQRSYAQIAEQFGCSEGQAKDAIVFLEEMGVVRREFRTIEAKGMKYNNILFLDLNADRLRELTYPAKASSPVPEYKSDPQNPALFFVPPSAGISPEGCTDFNTPMPESRQRGAEKSTDPVPEFHRYTENMIQETTTENSTKISAETSVRLTDGALREHTAFSDVESVGGLVSELVQTGVPTASVGVRDVAQGN
ncbi:MAG: DNA replication protein DnaD, partial [Oscillospiraceae bacterium]|nr:DNA replication protein DnaD [Oscillospiraceae bacterium]